MHLGKGQGKTILHYESHRLQKLR